MKRDDIGTQKLLKINVPLEGGGGERNKIDEVKQTLGEVL